MRKFLLSLPAILVATSGLAADWRDAAVASFKKDERSVVDAMFTQPISVWVSMRDDGSRRDGFAEYLCIRLHEKGMKPGDFVAIHIWDAAALAQGEQVEIGSYNCENNN